MTQYTHDYKPAWHCNNHIAANGVVKAGRCSHVKQFQEPHCERCGKEKTSSVHQTEEVQSESLP